jgi:hypothetical protein
MSPGRAGAKILLSFLESFFSYVNLGCVFSHVVCFGGVWCWSIMSAAFSNILLRQARPIAKPVLTRAFSAAAPTVADVTVKINFVNEDVGSARF